MAALALREAQRVEARLMAPLGLWEAQQVEARLMAALALREAQQAWLAWQVARLVAALALREAQQVEAWEAQQQVEARSMVDWEAETVVAM